ncbi:MAG TPA: hypothetical protein VEJ87_00950 [Acidimicrobiales bacterium]|nr:hypothetical protein [Acidimicrobiales bacterium]
MSFDNHSAIDDYIRRSAAERRALEEAITQARARLARAHELERRLAEFEQRLGEYVVSAYTRSEPESPTGKPHEGAG